MWMLKEQQFIAAIRTLNEMGNRGEIKRRWGEYCRLRKTRSEWAL
jgi:hypothetical protein